MEEKEAKAKVLEEYHAAKDLVVKAAYNTASRIIQLLLNALLVAHRSMDDIEFYWHYG